MSEAVIFPAELYEDLQQSSEQLNSLSEGDVEVFNKKLNVNTEDVRSGIIEEDKVSTILKDYERKRYRAIGACLFYEGAEITTQVDDELRFNERMRQRFTSAAVKVKAAASAVKDFFWHSHYAKIVKRTAFVIGLGAMMFTSWFKYLWEAVKDWFSVDFSWAANLLDKILEYDYSSIGSNIAGYMQIVCDWFEGISSTNVSNSIKDFSISKVDDLIDAGMNGIVKGFYGMLLGDDSSMGKLLEFRGEDRWSKQAFMNIAYNSKEFSANEDGTRIAATAGEYSAEVRRFFDSLLTERLVSKDVVKYETEDYAYTDYDRKQKQASFYTTMAGVNIDWSNTESERLAVEQMQ